MFTKNTCRKSSQKEKTKKEPFESAQGLSIHITIVVAHPANTSHTQSSVAKRPPIAGATLPANAEKPPYSTFRNIGQTSTWPRNHGRGNSK